MKDIWKKYIETGDQHLIVYSLTYEMGHFNHYASSQVLFNALECYLKAYYLKKKIAKNYMKSHDLIGIINRCKKEDPKFLAWLDKILDYKKINFDLDKKRAAEIKKLPNHAELDANYKKIYSDADFYMLLKLGPDLKYGALDKDLKLRYRHFISGNNVTVINIIREIRHKFRLNSATGCLLRHNIKAKVLTAKANKYLRQYLS